MRFGLFGAEDAVVDQAADVGVIVRKARDGGTTHQVQAAVSYVREIELVVNQGHRRAGGSHPVQIGILVGIFLDALVRGLKAFQKPGTRDRLRPQLA